MCGFKIFLSLSVQNEFLFVKTEIRVLSEMAMNITNILRYVRCSGRYLPTVSWKLSCLQGRVHGEKMSKDIGKRLG